MLHFRSREPAGSRWFKQLSARELGGGALGLSVEAAKLEAFRRKKRFEPTHV